MELKITAISLIFIIFAVLALSFFMDNVAIKEGFNFRRFTPATTKPPTPASNTTKPVSTTTTPVSTTTTPVPTTTTPVPTTTMPPTPVPTSYCNSTTDPGPYEKCGDLLCKYTNVANMLCGKSFTST